MSLSRSPSPRRGGGWSSPGLTIGAGSSRGSSPRRGFNDIANSSTSSGNGAFYPNGSPIAGSGPGNGAVTWASAKAKSDRIVGYPSFSTRNNGFFSRQRRKISASLPRFRVNSMLDYSEKEKLGRGRWLPRGLGDMPMRARIKTLLGSLIRRKRFRYLLLLLLTFLFWLFFSTRIIQSYRASSIGGGKKIVMLVGSNIGGGVMEWKGAREWAIERDSLKNKRKYVQRWGYELEIVNMVTKKRYAHEWREGWEKVDAIRQALQRYPDAEWFWWLDLHTYIMEPTYSLQSHVLNHLESKAYRDINVFNPLNITHPPTAPYLDPISLSRTGDDKTSSINMILTQDCSGFNLGSFVLRRSTWTERLLDMWWDPVLYEQKHMAWEHKEQDSLEHLYINHPWVRPHVAFMPQRRMNSFPPGACGDGTDRRFHYLRKERDFIVNMAGCQWGRDCWGEMYYYRQLGYFLNRTWWERFKEGLADIFFKMIGRPLKRQFT
ncbi:mannan polymerase II complex MNN10 subunit [Blastomyces dermatitidis ER-3]|uniref:Mannan polymerase II complex MNN10 subunit n=3 Tax=Blastomyces TaxID=229219 RepID=A0A179U6D6_BLAGS|nr:mannan polymerase II complex MNN10 subunit [Blastomyces gilchristii SLH14081]XP_045273149.1 mannan polymerase II complex MNN10 subunit [Blastomyces dermatitidis ER-3]EEQ85381.2 mannan polymerase II complex MNN10 subunit [Blastomyces dermatitidis ER-3]KMW66740.1 mannan polymerase II complex MNN10 subunit [Blastomyces dermatitidis ATCC 18188]OAT03293.1 mannan polymerase II complex MNN10 subunit [Blastomyces gilchristii SLH14081]